MDLYLILVAFLIILMLLCYMWLDKKYRYWEDKGIKGPKPMPIVGNFGKIMVAVENIDLLLNKIYNNYANEKYVGVYQGLKPALVIRDLEMIQQIFIQDFNVFHSRGFKNAYPLNDQAFFAVGPQWKVLRSILTPRLTIGKLKRRVPLVAKSTDEFLKYVDELLEHGNVHEFQYNLIWKYNLHCIGAFLFGVDLKVFSHEKHAFSYILDEIFLPGVSSKIVSYIDQFIPGFQKIASMLKIDPKINMLTQKFKPFVDKVMQARVDQSSTDNDFTDFMIKLLQEKFVEKQDKILKFERRDMVLFNQYVLMYSGHLEPITTFMSSLLHRLAFHQNYQERAYREICEVTNKHNGEITYESLNDMVYLEMILDEVLRKYAVGFIQREASTDYEFTEAKLKIEKGTLVMIPVRGLHYDPKYYKNPEMFDPERFSAENKKKIPQMAYLPFGDGPRACLGQNSSKLQMKYGIAAFLRKFKLETCDRTKEKIEFHKGGIGLTRSNGIWLKVSRRSMDI